MSPCASPYRVFVLGKLAKAQPTNPCAPPRADSRPLRHHHRLGMGTGSDLGYGAVEASEKRVPVHTGRHAQAEFTPAHEKVVCE